MAHGDVKHDYHLVNPSPWPVVGSIGALFSAVGGDRADARHPRTTQDNFFFGKGHWPLFADRRGDPRVHLRPAGGST